MSSTAPMPRRPNILFLMTDRRLHIGDVGNARIVSVKLNYHATEKVKLGDVPGK